MPALSNVRRSIRGLIPFGIVALFACSESTAPPLGGDLAVTNAVSASAKRTTSFAPNKETTTTDAAPLPANVIKFASWAAPLSSYDTSFAVVVGTASTHQVMYKGMSLPFLKLEIPANADFFSANGATLKKGTKVVVTASIDRVYATVKFGPHGTSFQNYPAKVCLNYYALDLGGRSPAQLGVWYQPDSLTAWSAQPTQLDVSFWWLCASLDHFSNYAVAY
jgi:hypothetical protein